MAYFKNRTVLQNGNVTKGKKVAYTLAATLVTTNIYGISQSYANNDGLVSTSNNKIEQEYEESSDIGLVEVIKEGIRGIFGGDVEETFDEVDTNEKESEEVQENNGLKELFNITFGGLFGNEELESIGFEEEVEKEPTWLEETLDIAFSGLNPKKRSLDEFEPEVTTVDNSKGTASENNNEQTNTSEEKSDNEFTESEKTEEEFIKLTKSYLNKGIVYKWGGKTAPKLDCSGYVSSILIDLGISIDKDMTNVMKYKKITTEVNREDIEVGDLVFWHNLKDKSKAPIDHIGFYIGNDTVIDCSPAHSGLGTRKLSSLKDSSARKYTFGKHEELEKLIIRD